jgi:hypothetical protein
MERFPPLARLDLRGSGLGSLDALKELKGLNALTLNLGGASGGGEGISIRPCRAGCACRMELMARRS